MSTSAVTPAAPAVATSAPAPSCGNKISKSMTIVGGLLAAAVALAEGSRFLDLSANIFEHLPSTETNLVIGVVGVTGMIAGQVLGRAEPLPQKAVALKGIEKAINKEAEDSQFLRMREILIEGFDKALDRVKEIQEHPQSRVDEENRQREKDDPLARELMNALKVHQGLTSGPLFSEADTKLTSLLQYIGWSLFSNSKDLEEGTIRKLLQLRNEVDALVEYRLSCLNNRAWELQNQEVDVTDFEKTFDEIMSKVNPTESNAIDQLDKILKEVAAVIESEISSDGEEDEAKPVVPSGPTDINNSNN